MGRVNRPALMIYGGTIKPGHSKEGKVLDIISVFQSYGEFITGKLDENPRARTSCNTPVPAPGLRRHVHRHTTMASAIGRSACRCLTARPRRRWIPGKTEECLKAGAAVHHLLGTISSRATS